MLAKFGCPSPREALRRLLAASVFAIPAAAAAQNAVWTQGTGWPEYIYVQSLVLDPQNPSRLWAGGVAGHEGNPGLLRSDDEGASWTTIQGPGAPGDVQAIAIHPENASTVFTGFNLVRRSDDGGSHWMSFETPGGVDRGWFGYGSVNALAIDPYFPGRLWAATTSGLSHSEDGGQTWTATTRLTKEIYRVLFDGRSPGLMYASTYDHEELVDSYYYPDPFLSRRGGDILSSGDGGATWFQRAVVDFPILSFAVDPLENVVYAGSLGAVHRSADLGITWEKISVVFPWEWAFSIVADPVRKSWIYAAAGWDVYRSTDSGRTWHRLAAGLPEGEVHALAISPDGRRLYAGSQGGTGGVYSLDLEEQDAPCALVHSPCRHRPRVLNR